MDREPVKPPDASPASLLELPVVIGRYEERVLAVLAEGAVRIFEGLSAVSAGNGKMAHDSLP
jgi:hypothetical protein